VEKFHPPKSDEFMIFCGKLVKSVMLGRYRSIPMSVPEMNKMNTRTKYSNLFFSLAKKNRKNAATV
jgi:hypothetical protein